MKKNDLFLLMSEIDPQYVSEAENATQRSTKKSENHLGIAWQKWGALAAACLIVLLCAVPVVKRLMNGVTPGVIPPDTVPGTDVVENPDFIIENGVLLSYVGDETEIIIPEGVVKIAQQAFLSAPEVTSIHLPKSLEEIEPLTFAELLSLSSFTVDEKNEYLKVIENVLIKRNGTIIVPSQGTDPGEMGDAFFYHTFSLLEKAGYTKNAIDVIEIGNAIIELYDEDSPDILPYIKSITAFGQSIHLNNYEIGLYGNFKLTAFEANGCFVLSCISYYSPHEYNYIITKEGIFKIPIYTPEETAWYEQSTLSFYLQDGNLYYQTQARKFHGKQYVGQFVEFCVSKDELYEEIGTVKIEGGTLTLIPETLLTVSEGLDLDEEYQQYVDSLLEHDPTALVVSLDDYLANNAKYYPRVNEEYAKVYFASTNND